MKDKVILGLDIGGTYIKFVKKENGNITKGKEYIADIKHDREKLLEKIVQIIKDNSPEKVGIAVAGLYDAVEDVLTDSPNLKSLQNVNLKEFIREKTRIEPIIQNDATLAAYGEYIYGAGQGSKVLVCLTFGTGLGSGLVINGEPFIGVSGSAMEIGHTTININGWPCHCGRKGCLEAYVSSYGLERIYFFKTDKYMSSFEIITKANEGELAAMESMEELSKYLAIGLMNIVHILNPDRILFAGGIVENYPVLEEMAYADLKKLAFHLPFRDLDIKLAKLGEFSGAFGALALAEK